MLYNKIETSLTNNISTMNFTFFVYIRFNIDNMPVCRQTKKLKYNFKKISFYEISNFTLEYYDQNVKRLLNSIILKNVKSLNKNIIGNKELFDKNIELLN